MAIDRENFEVMLKTAGIPYAVKPTEPINDSATGSVPPKGLVSLMVDSSDHSHSWRAGKQPHPGGYGHFFTEVIFTAEGKLWAIWAWE